MEGAPRLAPGSRSLPPFDAEVFVRAAPWTAEGAAGFVVRIETSSGVSYADASGHVFLDGEGRVFLECERLSPGVRVHLDSPRTGGLVGVSPERVQEVLHRVARALQYLGYRLESVGRVPRRSRIRWPWPLDGGRPD